MQQVHTKQDVRYAVASARTCGKRVALVPTMGFLHRGHLALIEHARRSADWVGVSVFVNPLQFGPTEDLDRYPRDLERDAAVAREHGADLLFAPAVAEMYPAGEPSVVVVPDQGADVLCGASRPGHFRGVLTVVAKLFGVFSPDVAVFGQKDFQQVALIRRMVADLDMPVELAVVPTVREEDGLALSSRNAYLSASQRQAALAVFRAIRSCEERFAAGVADARALRAEMHGVFAAAGIEPEYADLVDAETLLPVETVRAGIVCAVAARLGATRLIDNAVLAAGLFSGAPALATIEAGTS